MKEAKTKMTPKKWITKTHDETKKKTKTTKKTNKGNHTKKYDEEAE